MTAWATLAHHGQGQAQLLPASQPKVATAGAAGATGGSTASGAADTSAATISANDFLTLLVTEMQNQDPTANTDPNEYVNQLVNVNSLEQLISINQTLGGAFGSTGTTGTTGTGTGSTGTTGGTQAATGAVSRPASSAGTAPEASAAPIGASVVHPGPWAAGNLSVPPAQAAAQRVAQALGGGSGAH